MRKRSVQALPLVLMSLGFGLAGLGLSPGIAQAAPSIVPADDDHWCPPFVPCDWQPGWGWQGPWWQGDQGNQGGNQQ